MSRGRESNAHNLRRARLASGLTLGELARRAGVSRQALGAIESGLYQPGVAVALRIAREVGATVEQLFGEDEPKEVEARWPYGEAAHPHGTRVALARVGGRVVAMPQSQASLRLTPAAGLLRRSDHGKAMITSFRTASEVDSTLLIAGCDPAVPILSEWLARHSTPLSVVSLSCSSRRALAELAAGRVHIAGVHLRDPESGEYNLAPVREALPDGHFVLVNFARWELGFATASGNPLSISGETDLARKAIRIANREPGSGARFVLDEALARLNLPPPSLRGYDREYGGHLEVAAAVAAGEADLGMTIRLAAQAYGLGFVPLREERYDFVMADEESRSGTPAKVFDTLASGRFHRELSALCAYDTTRTGELIARW
jgi:putative molybdopterin biosynthesis protein